LIPILWLVSDPMGEGLIECDSEDDAREELSAALDATRDRASDGWDGGDACPALYRCERVAHVEPHTTPVADLPEEEAGWMRRNGWDFRVEFEIAEDDAPPPADPALLAAANRALAEQVERLEANATAREGVLRRERELWRQAERERDEALADLAAGRGDTAGGPPGWRWDADQRQWHHRARNLVVDRGTFPEDGWEHWLGHTSRGGVEHYGTAPTARAAMRAAEAKSPSKDGEER